MKQYFSTSENDTMQIAADFAKECSGGTVIAFTGGLGMGKTAFTRGFLRGLNNNARVSSPTFALVNDYGGTPTVYHFDMYRVGDIDDLYSTGYFDYLSEDAMLLIEWSENITDFLPENTVFVEIRKGEQDNERIITIRNGENE